jgi:hypothetical protein
MLLTLIGQPFYKARRRIWTIASIAGLWPKQHWRGVHFLGPPRPGNPVHTRLMGPSHRVVGRAMNYSLPGQPGLRSSLGGEAASIWESSLAVLFSLNTAELVSSHWFVQCVHFTLYSVYTV